MHATSLTRRFPRADRPRRHLRPHPGQVRSGWGGGEGGGGGALGKDM